MLISRRQRHHTYESSSRRKTARRVASPVMHRGLFRYCAVAGQFIVGGGNRSRTPLICDHRSGPDGGILARSIFVPALATTGLPYRPLQTLAQFVDEELLRVLLDFHDLAAAAA